MTKEILNIFKSADTGKYDRHLILFFLNIFLVVLGYSLAGSSFFQLVKMTRIILVGISLRALFLRRNEPVYYFNTRKNWVIWIFVVLNVYILVFSVDFIGSLMRLITWLPFIVYINYFVVYLFRTYDKQMARIKILQILNISYFYPLIILFIFGNPFLNQNIYGLFIGGFKTNTISWSATVFFLTGVDVLSNVNQSTLYKRVLIIAIIFALYVVFISGSRSSYLCVVIALSTFVLSSRKIKFFSKFAVALFIVAFTFYMINDKNSALNKRLEKTEKQIEKGESRLNLARIALETMSNNPKTLLVGFGFDNFSNGILRYNGLQIKIASHNSYLELLCTTGIFVFSFFLIFMVVNALLKYIIFDIRKFIFVPSLFIIPFFESNLTAGQFLFFPWMFIMFYYVHVSSLQLSIKQFLENKDLIKNRVEIDTEVKHFI